MKKPRMGTHFAVFLLFFGIALLDAFQKQDWLRAAFWLAIALVFLIADAKDFDYRQRPKS